MQPPVRVPILERLRFGSYGLIAGLLFGLFLGWMFHGLIGAIFRIVFVVMILVPLALALVYWLRVNQQNHQERSDIQEAEWRDLTEPR